MTRDKETLQFILEELEDSPNNAVKFWSDDLPGDHTLKDLYHHASLLKKGGYIEHVEVQHNVARERKATAAQMNKKTITLEGVTLEGYDYLDELRD